MVLAVYTTQVVPPELRGLELVQACKENNTPLAQVSPIAVRCVTISSYQE